MSIVLLTLGGLVLVLATPLLRARPSLILALYLIPIAFVPYWIGIQVGPQYLPLSFAVALCTAVLAYDGRMRSTGADWIMILLLGALTLGTLVGVIELPHALAVAGGWLAPYAAGRQLAHRVECSTMTIAIAWVAVVLAAQAVVEFTLNWHPFMELTWQGGPADIWRGIQYRSTFARSEGAMGHSISLGGVIALGAPFVLLARWSFRWRVAAMVVLGVGVAVTFSRNALIAYFAASVLTALFAHHRQLSAAARRGIIGSLSLLAIGFVPLYLRAIDGGTGVLAASTDYRANYISLIPSVEWFGLASIYVEYAPGRWGWQSDLYANDIVVTLDNTILLTALQFGWVPMGFLVALLMWLGLMLIRGPRGNAAMIAVCGQFFTIATVAMITQYPYLLWLVVGVAVTAISEARYSEDVSLRRLSPARRADREKLAAETLDMGGAPK